MTYPSGDPALPLRWGSITKTVTSLTVIDVAQTRQISLDTKVLDHSPADRWHNEWRRTHPVTIRQLLELTAGFPDLSGQEFNYTEPVTFEEALEINPTHRTTRWPPGIQHVYSNMTPGLSQLLVETLTGRPFHTAMGKTFGDLGMTGASLLPDPALPGGFRADGVTPIPYWHMTFPAYGAMNASSKDLARLLLHLMQQFNKDRSHVLFRPATTLAARAGLEIGYAAGLYSRIRDGRIWHTHGGDADGYRSRMAFLVSTDNRTRHGYIVNINTDNPAVLRQIERRIEKHLTDLEGDTPSPPSRETTSASHLEGTYYPTGVRFGIDSWQRGAGSVAHLTTAPDGSLQLRRGTRTTTLLPVGDRLYRRESDPVATVAFVEHRGSLYLQGELGNYVRTDRCPDYMHAISICQPSDP